MKIKLYRSSTIGLISENFKILQDPWLTDGEFLALGRIILKTR